MTIVINTADNEHALARRFLNQIGLVSVFYCLSNTLFSIVLLCLSVLDAPKKNTRAFVKVMKTRKESFI
ncbi:MAG: hypothetical protein CL599_04815 [Alteromonas sp.]|nr:hypothetical protein [Alteromonas sp.]OUX90518.1 MAG: hypothetical protein CBB95_04690 [Alteromonas sp. TMED35]